MKANELKAIKGKIEKAGFTVHTIGRMRIVGMMGLTVRKAQELLGELRRTYPRKPDEKPYADKTKFAARPPEEAIDAITEHHLRREVKELKEKLRETIEAKDRDEAYEHFVSLVAERARNVTPPDWMIKPRGKGGKHKATPLSFFSDSHFDEVIHPEQVNFVNAYNRTIALGRLERFFQNTIELTKDYLAGLEYDGLVMPFGGDTFSGNIHDELKQTNEDTLAGSLIFWLDPMIAGIEMLAEHYGSVYIPLVVGNHPRGTPKPIHKMRVRDNFDWLFAQLLARHFAKDKRVTFNISESPDCEFRIYDKRFLLTHGDQFRGGSGISGLLSPMMIGNARKKDRQQAINSPYDYLLMGHWHQRINAMGVFVNGSMVGYNEYAFNNNFKFEPPQQTFFVVDPRWGVTITAPIHVVGEDEGWQRKG